MKKTILLSIALMAAGFLAATAQNDISARKYQGENARFEYSDFEKPKLSTPIKTTSGQVWWVPDTISVTYLYSNSWVDNLDRRFIHKYNTQGLLKEYIEQRVINNLNSWRNDNSYTYTYDANNNLLNQLNQTWVNNSWVNNNQTIYTYDANNNLLTQLNQTRVHNSWRNDNQITYTYDSNNNILTRLNQTLENYVLADRFLYIFTYDSNNNMLTQLVERSKNNSLDSRVLVTYTYNSNNNMLTELSQAWKDDNSWKNFNLITYIYDSNNNRLSKLKQIWMNNSWVNDDQFLMTYDENGNGISAEYWMQIEERWLPLNEPTIDINLYYNNMQSYFRLNACHKLTASSYTKVSNNVTAIAEPSATPGLNDVSVYPNPTTGELRIENGALKIQQISIFNLLGRNVLNTQQTALDISHLPAGIYFVQIKTEKGVVTKKIVKR
jgi:hypothetical protein